MVLIERGSVDCSELLLGLPFHLVFIPGHLVQIEDLFETKRHKITLEVDDR